MSERCLWCDEEVDETATWVTAWPFFGLPDGFMHRECEEEAQEQEHEERHLHCARCDGSHHPDDDCDPDALGDKEVGLYWAAMYSKHDRC